MDETAIIIKNLRWPVTVLIIVIIFIIIFRKVLSQLIQKIKTINVSKSDGVRVLFEDQQLSSGKNEITKEEEQSVSIGKLKMVDPIKWNKFGSLYWLANDLMWTVDIILRGAPKNRIIKGLTQSIKHLQSLGFEKTILMEWLQELKNDAVESNPKDWTQEKRKQFANKISGVKRHIGVLAELNQPDFKA